MGRRRKQIAKSKHIEDFVTSVNLVVKKEKTSIIKRKDEINFRISQACDLMIMELAARNDENRYVAENKEKTSELPFKFALPSSSKKVCNSDKSASERNIGLAYSTPYNTAVPNFCITPKVNPYSPVSMLRLPQEGEFAVSASGSPLQVMCLGNSVASVNIPLKNGKVMSVLPKPGINTDIIHGNLEPEVKRQLETLQHALSKILNE